MIWHMNRSVECLLLALEKQSFICFSKASKDICFSSAYSRTHSSCPRSFNVYNEKSFCSVCSIASGDNASLLFHVRRPFSASFLLLHVMCTDTRPKSSIFFLSPMMILLSIFDDDNLVFDAGSMETNLFIRFTRNCTATSKISGDFLIIMTARTPESLSKIARASLSTYDDQIGLVNTGYSQRASSQEGQYPSPVQFYFRNSKIYNDKKKSNIVVYRQTASPVKITIE